MAIKMTSLFSRLNAILLAIFFLIATLLCWSGIPGVPFHPDESTQLFMSADFDLFLASPLSLSWQPGSESDLRSHYRLIDAPLTRMWIGFARRVANIPPLPADWNWSLSWLENLSGGAHPDSGLLNLSRFSVALFYPFSLFLAYLIGKHLGGNRLGWLALILLAINALVLLHARRAMAEGMLLFTLLLAIWALLTRKPTWLIALLVGLAFAAKQSTLSIALVSIAVIGFRLLHHRQPFSRIVFNLLIFIGVFAGFNLVVNPFLWNSPLQAIEASIKERQQLLDRQVADIGAVSQEVILNSPSEKLLGLIANLYITPPAISDVGNYNSDLAETSRQYLAQPIHTMLRDPSGGIIILILSLFGFVTMLVSVFRPDPQRAALLIILLAGLAQFASLALTVPLPFQRYVLPLVPYVSFSVAYGLNAIFTMLQKKIAHGKNP